MKQTIFHDLHLELRARMAPFGGFDMPIQYAGILAEHEQTRTAASLFDTCHMGEFEVHGDGAAAALDGIVTCHVATLEVSQCRYGLLCTPEGGVLDDLLVYRLADDGFMLVVNAGTQDDDFDWICSHLPPDVKAINISAQTAKVDIQGPESPGMMARLMDQPIDGMRFYRWAPNSFGGTPIRISRTGYTGEIGFEIYADAKTAIDFWKSAMTLGAKPAGLGARDTLRLEMGMPLYGHELSRERNAAQAGFALAVAADKGFIGSQAVQDAQAASQKLVGLVLEGRRAARQGDRVLADDGRDIGVVTSGSYGPSVGSAVALAYVEAQVAETMGGSVVVKTARQELTATVEPLPFYKHGTARRKLEPFLRRTG